MPLPGIPEGRLRLPIIAAPMSLVSGPDPVIAARKAGVLEAAKAWRDYWSAGHGVSAIDDIPEVAVLVARLEAAYRAACGV